MKLKSLKGAIMEGGQLRGWTGIPAGVGIWAIGETVDAQFMASKIQATTQLGAVVRNLVPKVLGCAALMVFPQTRSMGTWALGTTAALAAWGEIDYRRQLSAQTSFTQQQLPAASSAASSNPFSGAVEIIS